MTEDEAKGKACCGPPAVANAIYWKGDAPVEDSPMKCTGSACMAWRWTSVRSPPSKGHPHGSTIVHGGFCGFANAPSL